MGAACKSWVTKDARPFGKGPIGRDHNRGALVDPADQGEEPLSAGPGERQIAELVEPDEVHAGEVVGQPSLPAGAGLAFPPVHQVEDGVTAAPCTAANG